MDEVKSSIHNDARAEKAHCAISGFAAAAVIAGRQIMGMQHGGSFRTSPDAMVGSKILARTQDFSDSIAFDDHKVSYVVRYAAGRDVLDLGCVQHNPQGYKSRYWVHNALRQRASSVLGMDLAADGVAYLQARGFDIIHGDAQNYDLGRDFDVIVAGDLIEHLEDFAGFRKREAAFAARRLAADLDAQSLVLTDGRSVDPLHGSA